jgi:hypothetical protein
MLKRFENLIVFDLIKIHEEGKGEAVNGEEIRWVFFPLSPKTASRYFAADFR